MEERPEGSIDSFLMKGDLMETHVKDFIVDMTNEFGRTQGIKSEMPVEADTIPHPPNCTLT